MSSDTLKQKFSELKKEGLPALLTYTVGGDPSKDVSLEIFKSIAESGADIIECGLGHSANIGDGAAIQDSTYRALSNGIQTDDVFSIIKSFTIPAGKQIKTPNTKTIAIICLGSLNLSEK